MSDEQDDDTAARDATAAPPKTRRARRAEKSGEASTSDIKERGQRARDAAAARRRAKRSEERAAASVEGLDAGEMVDDALARGTHTAAQLLQRHFRWLQWVIVLGVVGSFTWLIYSYRHNREVANASAELAKGYEAEFGKLPEDTDLNLASLAGADPRQEFKSDEERLKAAEAAYRATIDGDESEVRRTLARMGLAGILLDQEKYKDALAAYLEVKDSELAASDRDLKARALEGIGMAQEGLDKDQDALKTFKELTNLEGEGFQVLGNYHQARLLLAMGEKEKAKELLKKNLEKLSKKDVDATQPSPPSFSETASRQMLQLIDPSAVPAPAAGGITPEQLEALKAQLANAGGGEVDIKELLKTMGDGEGPIAPPENLDPRKEAPAPTPEPTKGEPAKGEPAKGGAPEAPKPAQPPPAPEPPAPKPPAPKAPVTPKPAAPKAPAPAPAAPAPPAPAAPPAAPPPGPAAPAAPTPPPTAPGGPQ